MNQPAEQPKPSQVLTLALFYALERNWAVFPLHTPLPNGGCSCGKPECDDVGKHPRTPNGCKNATTSEALIRTWFRRWSSANIGLATGKESGIVALDVDPRHEGDESLAELERLHGPLPHTTRSKTGGGGFHLLFAYPEGDMDLRNMQRLADLPGLDVRANGGYIVVPPSMHTSGRRYAWDPSALPRETPLAPLPEWLLKLMLPRKRPDAAPADSNGTLQIVPEGERNHYLLKLAGKLRRLDLQEEAIAAALLEHNARLCRPPLPEKKVTDMARYIMKFPPAAVLMAPEVLRATEIWPEPRPLPHGLLPVPALPPALIPDPLRPWLTDVAERIQCPLEYPAVGAIVALSAVIGRAVCIRPKRHDDWVAVPNLWGAAVGRPGIMKSPALREALRPLRRLVADAQLRHREAEQEYEFLSVVQRARKKELADRVAEAVRNKEDVEQLRAEYCSGTDEPPLERRYLVNDSTVEKLGELLNQNPRGLLVYRDELTGLLRSLDREDRANDRPFYLEAWDGMNPYTYDRIGRGTLHIASTCLAILGGIQPGPLVHYLRDAVAGGMADDGLMQRFQMLVYPDAPCEWRNVDRWPDSDARNLAYDICRALAHLGPADVGAVQEKDDDIPFLRFAPDAQEFFDGWRTELERHLQPGKESAAMEGHLAKYRSFMPSLAEIFHLVDLASGRAHAPAVSLKAAELAAGWCSFLEPHARRVYGLVSDASASGAHTIVRHIRKGDLANPFTARDVYDKGWSGLTSAAAVAGPLALLMDYGWLRGVEVEHSGPGRPRTEFAINPKALKP